MDVNELEGIIIAGIIIGIILMVLLIIIGILELYANKGSTKVRSRTRRK